MRSLDHLFEHSSRSLARRTSRRSLLASLGQLLTGAALLPLLPVDRGGRAWASDATPKPDSPESCEYWKYCAIDGFLCSCCGGTSSSHHLDRHLPQPRRRPRLHRLLQRLLREDQLRQLRVQP